MVQPKQTLERIAAAYLPLTDLYTRKSLMHAIALANGLSPRKPLTVGDGIVIPGARAAAEPSVRMGHDAGFEARGIYVTAPVAGTERLFNLVERLKPLGINTVVFDVKDVDGIVSFESQAELARTTHAAKKGTHLDLVKLVGRLHARGMHVIAREALFQDRWLARRRHDLALRHKGGDVWRENGKVGWVDPANEAVQAYNLEPSRARRRRPGWTRSSSITCASRPWGGSRRSTTPSTWSGRPSTRSSRASSSGRAACSSRSGCCSPSTSTASRAWEEDKDLGTTGQKIADLARLADVVSPMLYPSHYYRGFHGSTIPALEPYHFVHKGIRRLFETAAPHPVHVRPWLQAFPYRTGNAFDADYVERQIEAARDARATGLSALGYEEPVPRRRATLARLHTEDTRP